MAFAVFRRRTRRARTLLRSSLAPGGDLLPPHAVAVKSIGGGVHALKGHHLLPVGGGKDRQDLRVFVADQEARLKLPLGHSLHRGVEGGPPPLLDVEAGDPPGGCRTQALKGFYEPLPLPWWVGIGQGQELLLLDGEGILSPLRGAAAHRGGRAEAAA